MTISITQLREEIEITRRGLAQMESQLGEAEMSVRSWRTAGSTMPRKCIPAPVRRKTLRPTWRRPAQPGLVAYVDSVSRKY